MIDELKIVLLSIQEAVDFFGIEITDINQRGIFGNTPLKIAAVRGDAKAVSILLRAGADVNAIVEDGCTALHYAAGFNHTEIVQLLLEHGAFTDVRNDFGRTPIEDAELSGNAEAVEMIKAYVGR
jgi:ankyrin repeat protein